MKSLFFISLVYSVSVFANENAFMSLVSKFNPPKDKEIILNEKLEITENAIKSKSYNRNKFYGMKHIKYVSMFHESNDPKKDYLVSFYFHGEPNELAVKISPVDLRKYFQKKLAIDSLENQCTKTIQAHFEEYNRKSRVYYLKQEPLTLNQESPFMDMANKAKENAIVLKNPSNAFVITNNCRGIGNFEYEWPGLIKGHFFIPPVYLDKIMGEYDLVQINDHQSIPLNHENAHTELRTTKYYAELTKLGGWFGLKNKFVQWYSSNKDPVYQWYDLGDFDSASKNCSLSKIENGLIKNMNSNSAIKLPVTRVTGKIPYEEFTAETRMKSGAVYMQESLAYTKTPCDGEEMRNPPPNFLVPEGEKEGLIPRDEYWKTNKCAIIPHFFASYEDILNYPVYLSKFEIDGVYVGRSRNEDDLVITSFDKGLQKDETKRVPYFFGKYLANYKEAIIENNNNYLTIKLLNKDKNIILGNIPLKSLIEEEKKPQFVSSFNDLDLFETNVVGLTGLFGINPQPLVQNYNASFDPEVIDHNPSTFALMYDDQGNILNHHLPANGIELWYVRKRGCNLVVDLISHERILPLARLEMDYFCGEKK